MRVEVELQSDDERRSVVGTVSLPDGTSTSFHGWLDLLRLFETALDEPGEGPPSGRDTT